MSATTNPVSVPPSVEGRLASIPSPRLIVQHLDRSVVSQGRATTLTEAGYGGEDVESILHKLLVAAEMDVQVAQRGIVYIDEIDKLGGGRALGTKDLRLGVQHALLKMIEGTVASVPPSGSHKQLTSEPCIPFDTSQVLFICGGAFVELEEIVA